MEHSDLMWNVRAGSHPVWNPTPPIAGNLGSHLPRAVLSTAQSPWEMQDAIYWFLRMRSVALVFTDAVFLLQTEYLYASRRQFPDSLE